MSSFKIKLFSPFEALKIDEPSITTKDISTRGVALHNVYFVQYIFQATEQVQTYDKICVLNTIEQRFVPACSIAREKNNFF